MHQNDSKESPEDTVEASDYRPYTLEEDPPTLPFPHWEHLQRVLLPHHLEMLTKASAIDPLVIYERGYTSIVGAEGYTALKQCGFSRAQANNIPGLLLPLWTTDGQQPVSIYRPDNHRLDKDGRIIKYEVPTGASIRVDCHPRCQPMLGNPHIPLWCTEGQKKGDALVSLGACALALLGVYGWRGKNEQGGIVPLIDLELIAWNGREVRLAFDSDVWEKPQARKALERFKAFLHHKDATVRIVVLPSSPTGKMGVDDFIAQGKSLADLEALIDVPRPQPTPAPSKVKLLESAPPTLRKPLQLLDNHAYAATWLWVERTDTEGVDRQGNIFRYQQPKVTTEQALFIIRDDGVIFGEGSEQPFEALGARIHLPTMPRQERLWQVASVKAYNTGYRPNPAGVFSRVVAIYNRFIDFDRSLVEQETMCELSACFSLATWLHDAFSVLGYPWPTGEKGSGKTQWGVCWARTSYLGEILLSSGSFAALRDLAEYGAALLFDDAEIYADPKRVDPDKRELLLAGNRIGATIPLKEQIAPGRWETRWVNAYCSRGFTAIKTPDPVLASRSIILPLVKTADPRRGNADPAEDALWPEPQRELQDDLWALTLMLLPKASYVWRAIGEEVDTIGREFEPWRAVLTVARIFEHAGVEGLEGRIRQVMKTYQREKDELIGHQDRIILLVRALLARADQQCRDLVTGDSSDSSDSNSEIPSLEMLQTWKVEFTAKSLVPYVKKIVADESEDTTDMGEESADAYEENTETKKTWIMASVLGKYLSKLRLPQDRDNKKRQRTVTLETLLNLSRSYHVSISKFSYPHLWKLLSLLSLLSPVTSDFQEEEEGKTEVPPSSQVSSNGRIHEIF